jgi:CRP-like cAMP-binding protein
MAWVENLIPSSDLETVFGQLGTTVFKAKGTTLFRHGDEVSGAFLIRSGQISLGLDYETPVYPTRILGPGAIIGLPATVSGNPYSLTARALEDSELAFVPRDSLVTCLKNNPVLSFRVIDILGHEISDIRSAFKQNGRGRQQK